jgi:hypothetical protein
MPFRAHPELDKLFRQLPAPTCAACLLLGAYLSHKYDLIQTVEQLAMKAGYLAHGTCASCKVYKPVIRPA